MTKAAKEVCKALLGSGNVQAECTSQEEADRLQREVWAELQKKDGYEFFGDEVRRVCPVRHQPAACAKFLYVKPPLLFDEHGKVIGEEKRAEFALATQEMLDRRRAEAEGK